jgi:hypothetical protein
MFRLCNRSPGGVGGIGLDYRALRGNIYDYDSPVMTCATASACISFPLLLSVPPRLPEPGEVLRWRDGGHLFSIRTSAAGTYEIDVVEGPHGPRASVSRRYRYGYDVHRGITSYRAESGTSEQRLCGGHLTFEDLQRLRRRLVPDERHDPTLGEPAGELDRQPADLELPKPDSDPDKG